MNTLSEQELNFILSWVALNNFLVRPFLMADGYGCDLVSGISDSAIAYIKQGDGILGGVYGKGGTPTDAFVDMCRKYNGQTLVFDSQERLEVVFPSLISI